MKKCKVLNETCEVNLEHYVVWGPSLHCNDILKFESLLEEGIG